MRSTLLDLQSDISVELEVFGKPYSGEVAPAKLLDDGVAIEKHFADMNRVVPANFVIFNSFVLAVVLFFQLFKNLRNLLLALRIDKNVILHPFSVV